MSFLRSPFATDLPPHLRGASVLLRAPETGDYEQWANLRMVSREFLSPWEPLWPANDLTRGAFRARIRQYWRDIDDDVAYPYFIFDAGRQQLLVADAVKVGLVAQRLRYTQVVGLALGLRGRRDQRQQRDQRPGPKW